MTAKNFKFQALVTLPGGEPGPAAVPPGQVRRMVVRGQHHPSEYFGGSDRFALWLGGDVAGGVVTRRLFV
jgi:hypothetical protein